MRQVEHKEIWWLAQGDPATRHQSVKQSCLLGVKIQETDLEGGRPRLLKRILAGPGPSPRESKSWEDKVM